MIPRFSPNYGFEEILRCFLPVARDSVARLEQAFVARTGHESAIALKYGRTGLYYLLKALDVKNKKVILPSYTCVVVAHAVTLSGNIPVFLDNAPGRFQPAPEDYLTAVAAAPEQTAMIIPTHLFGVAEETKALYERIKSRYPHVFVLQDCAHGYFTVDREGAVVTQWGDGAIFGMNISKLLNSVRGGMLTLKNAVLAQKVRELIEQDRLQNSIKPFGLDEMKARLYAFAAALAFTPLFYGVVYWLIHHTRLLSSETDYYHPDQIDLPDDFQSPMLPFEAAIGLQSLARYEARITARRALASRYVEVLSRLRQDGIELLFAEAHEGNTWSHFPVFIPPKRRDCVRQRLEQELGVEIGIIVDYSVADLPAYVQKGYPTTPHAREMAEGIINLPLGLYESRFGFPVKTSQVETLLQGLEKILREELA